MLATDLLANVCGYLNGSTPIYDANKVEQVGPDYAGLAYDPSLFRERVANPGVFRDLEVYVRMPEDVAMEEGDLTTFTENMGQLIDGELVQFVSADSNFHLRRL